MPVKTVVSAVYAGSLSMFFSSPELRLLRVSYCDRTVSVVCYPSFVFNF